MSGVMIVTGASRGIGARIAIQAAERGWDVCVNYARSKSAAQEVVSHIRDAGGNAIAVHADMACEPDVKALFRTVDQDLGPVTALVNNAGIVGPSVSIEDLTADRINNMMAVNVTGTILAAREAVKRMATKNGGNGGVIINISSVAARIGSPHEYLDYAASKGAVDTFTKGLALEVAEQGIRVNAVRPGLIDTEIHASGGDPDRAHRLAPNIPVKRVGQPDEIADSVMYLVSDAASYVTGAILDVSGGR